MERTFDPMAVRARQLAADMKALLAQHPQETSGILETGFLLAEAKKRERSLEERLRILGLMAAGMDDHFILRVPHLQELARQGDAHAQEQLQQIPAQWQPLLESASSYLTETLLPELEESGIHLTAIHDLLAEQRAWLRTYFQQRVYPLLTPLAVDSGRPFPFISSMSLNLLIQLPEELRGSHWHLPTYARVKVPRVLPRVVEVPPGGAIRSCVWSEDLLRFSVPELFRAMQVKGAYLFRVLRADTHRRSVLLEVPEEEPVGLQRQLAPMVRLDVEAKMPRETLNWLMAHLQAPAYATFRISGPLGPVQLVDLANLLVGDTLVQ